MDQINFAKITKPKESIFPPGFFKVLALEILSVLSAGTFGYLYWRHITGIGYGATILLAPLLALIIFSVLGTIFTVSTGRRMVVVLLQSIACCLFFLTFPMTVALFGFLTLFAMLLWGEVDAHGLGQNSLEVPAYSIARQYAGKIVTALTIFALIMYSPSVSAGKIFLPESAFMNFYSWAAGVVKGLYGEIDISGDIQTFSESLARYNLAGTREYVNIPPAAQETMVRQYSALNIGALQKYFCEEMPQDSTAAGRKPFCTALQPNEPAASFLFRYLSNLLMTWKQSLGAAFIVSWFILVYFFVRTLGVFLSIAAAFIAFVCYHLLLAVEFVKVVGEPRIKESPVFPSREGK